MKSGSEREEYEWPEPPNLLSEKAKRLYNFYVGRTVRTPGQIVLFTRGLESLDVVDKCEKLLQEQGLSLTSKRSGLLRQNPLFNVQREANAIFVKVWKQLRIDINLQPTQDGFGYEEII